VTLDNTSGMVSSIRGRSTTINTNDNIEVIVPNSRFISKSVINWSHSDNRVRFRIPVGVHYKSDVFHVREVLERAGLEHPGVLKQPPPSAKFIEFGDSSLNFELWVWVSDWTMRPAAFKSEVNYLIWKHLKEAEIEIPYPQRDLYIKEWRAPESGISPETPNTP
jgi:small-conductance mechanosensitive channel